MTTLPGGLDLLEPVSAAGNVLESEPISSTVETGWPKDRKMSASISLQPSEDVTEDPGEGDKEDWDEEDFILPIEYFVEDCKLPSHGIHPAELPKNLVSDEQLVSCFGPKAGKGGRNGHRWDLSKQIPPADILSLVQVIDGHDKPINGTIGVIFPRALYVERILGGRDQLEREGEDLTVQMAEVLDAIAASESKEKNLREQIEAAKKCREDTESQLLEVTNEISGKEKTLSQDQVEHDWKASSAASKVRRHLFTASGGGQTSQPPTPTLAPASSNVQQLKPVKIEGEKDNVGKSAGPKNRKGPKHSDDIVLPPPHKVKTRHATKSEIDKHMFHFFVQTAEEDYILEVWDRVGQSLFNITGQEFFETFGSDITQLHQFVYSRLSSSSWAITVIGKPTARGNLKAVSFSCVELTSPAVLVESAQGQVGVVKVRDSSRGKESAEPSSTSGPRPRASLLAMLRLQARLDDMRKDIAEAITALKLEQEEEFVDSNCDWVESL
ncbi:hypothetical protein R1sor_026737 [Riccia sorocarpa]|uniref:LOV domain-containing protein n=1 Tax=Riccia sorocarpa TaxID=122646 RepID=A0ABD3GHZ7_9MARC